VRRRQGGREGGREGVEERFCEDVGLDLSVSCPYFSYLLPPTTFLQYFYIVSG